MGIADCYRECRAGRNNWKAKDTEYCGARCGCRHGEALNSNALCETTKYEYLVRFRHIEHNFIAILECVQLLDVTARNLEYQTIN